MKKQMLVKHKGIGEITLIALVITIDGQAGLVNYSSLIFYSLTIDNILNIIVLLILVGVSIATLTGNNGILTQANRSKVENREETVEELANLWKNEREIEKRTDDEPKTLDTV